MNISHFTIETSEIATLHLNISGNIDLPEATSQINAICNFAEDKQPQIITIKLAHSTFSLFDSPQKIEIQEISHWEHAVRRIERIRATTIAIVSGNTSGPALDLLLATDYRIASTDFQLQIQMNAELAWPGMTLHRLVNQLGIARTRQLVMKANNMSAKQALDAALIDEICESSVEAALAEAISKFNKTSGTEHAIRRQLMLEAQFQTFEQGLGAHLAACDRELRRLFSEHHSEDKQSC
jgi:isomerase DpgB